MFYTHFFLHIFNTCWSIGDCFGTPGIHKSAENLVVTSEFLASDGWHKASPILGIHSSGMTCSTYCNLALSTCACNVTDIFSWVKYATITLKRFSDTVKNLVARATRSPDLVYTCETQYANHTSMISTLHIVGWPIIHPTQHINVEDHKNTLFKCSPTRSCLHGHLKYYHSDCY